MHAPNLWRCGSGRSIQVASAGNNGFVSLYSLPNSAESLAVWQISIASAANVAIRAGIVQGQQGSSAVNLTPAMPNQQPPPGQVTVGTAASIGTTSYAWGTSNLWGVAWFAPFPFCILPPGWSLQVWCTTVNQNIEVAFFVEACLPEVLIDRYGPRLSWTPPTQ